VTRALAALRAWYGGHPLHLLALLAAFALAGYAVRAMALAGGWQGAAAWFAVAIVGHDLLLFPLYALADLSLRRLLPRRPGGSGTGAAPAGPAPPPLNYLRVPAALSLLLLLVWFPLVLGLSSAAYRNASGRAESPFLWHWLAVTGVLFTASAVSYAIRRRRLTARQRPARQGPSAAPRGDG
jgi:hypothetical protein